uniref:Uncharacterized protein n=1 Tax=Amphimedon queenslandica TaxID=400682 RepID=A0A1X7U2Y4_AMPQE
MKLLHESLRINTLYPYQQPCCITYSQFKESITTAVSMREYCRLGRELYYSVHNMTKEIASDFLRQLSNGESPSSDNALLFLSQNLTEEEFLKEVLKLFQQQYSKCKKD